MIQGQWRDETNDEAMLMQTIHTDQCKTNAIQHIRKRVTTVIGNLEGMEVFFNMESLSQFDVVILAAPIQQSWIAFLILSDKVWVLDVPITIVMYCTALCFCPTQLSPHTSHV